MVDEGRAVIRTGEGDAVIIGGLGVVHKISGADTNGAFSVVGFWIGGEEFLAKAEEYVIKPRGVPHSFWNPGPERARIVETFSPAGFEPYFDELAAVVAEAAGGPPDLAKISEIAGRYGLVFHMETMPDFMERHEAEPR